MTTYVSFYEQKCLQGNCNFNKFSWFRDERPVTSCSMWIKKHLVFLFFSANSFKHDWHILWHGNVVIITILFIMFVLFCRSTRLSISKVTASFFKWQITVPFIFSFFLFFLSSSELGFSLIAMPRLKPQVCSLSPPPPYYFYLLICYGRSRISPVALILIKIFSFT